MKTCSVCGVVKPLLDFVKDNRKKAGVGARCKVCHNSMTRKYDADRQYTPEQIARKREYYDRWKQEMAASVEFQESIRRAKEKWRQANADAVREKNRRWKAANKDRVAEHVRHRQAKLRRAVPSWADRAKMLEIYRFAEEFRAAGFDVHVDHIIPLSGEMVSGLHCEGNLRVCLASVNQSKGNRLVDHLL